MDHADWQRILEEERLYKTMEALHEIRQCGLEDTAEFLSRELGVNDRFKQEASE
jgi:hypothetical protein